MLVELANKRTYNAKHFLKVLTDENGNPILNEQGELVPALTQDGRAQMTLKAHSGHIHYKDNEEFKPLDWTLFFDEEKRGWAFSTHSYHPFFPEYSDEWAEFRDLFQDKDQVIKYKPIGARVIGELLSVDDSNPDFDDNPDNKAVLYRDVFGPGRDYILYNKRSDMVKVATVNDPSKCTEDAIFEWEVEFPDKEIFRVDKREDAEDMTRLGTKTNTEDGKLVGYKLEKRDGKNVNTKKLTLIGDSRLDGKEWYTYLKSFRAWDSAGNQIDIIARISFTDGKVILKKTIPLEFLQRAIGRVFTDTTTSFYSSDADGYLAAYNASSFDSAHDASSGTLVNGLYLNANCQRDGAGAGVYMDRMTLLFDTSSIPSSNVITAASLSISIRYVEYDDNDSNCYLAVVQSKIATALPASADYTNIGESAASGFGNAKNTDIIYGSDETMYNTITPVASVITIGSQFFTINLNSTGFGFIAKSGQTKPTGAYYTGYTYLGVREGHDLEKDPILPVVANLVNMFAGYSANNTGANDPYLSVTYSAPPPATAAFLFNLIS